VRVRVRVRLRLRVRVRVEEAACARAARLGAHLLTQAVLQPEVAHGAVDAHRVDDLGRALVSDRVAVDLQRAQRLVLAQAVRERDGALEPHAVAREVEEL